MTLRQLRYRLRKEGYLLRKRGDGYMIVDGERNWVIAGGDGNGYSLTFDKIRPANAPILLLRRPCECPRNRSGQHQPRFDP